MLAPRAVGDTQGMVVGEEGASIPGCSKGAGHSLSPPPPVLSNSLKGSQLSIRMEGPCGEPVACKCMRLRGASTQEKVAQA
jgi:hypothetical protein